ncbi:MAG: hypothetical protein HXY37_04900 [Chloroflexi bacterium]|nr:hypothetical protein [Chloroflexota bacterium]
MTVETDALTEAALRFSEAIRAERTSTLDALARERQAALQIIEALKQEAARRREAASGRFLVGMLIGVTAGAVAVYLINQRTSEEARLGLTARPQPSGPSLAERFRAAVATGRTVAQSREAELWQRYRQRLAEGLKPPQPPEEPLF